MLVTVLFSLLCMALFAVIGLFWWTRKTLGLPRRGALGRIAQWAEGVRSSEAEVKTATVGDLVLFVTLYIIGVTFVIALFTWWNGSTESSYKQDAQHLKQTTDSMESQIKDQEQELKELRKLKETPQPFLPAMDEQIIGNHVDFRWEYNNHNATTDYVLQFIRISGPATSRAPTSDVSPRKQPEVKQLDLGVPCTVAATDSGAKRSRFPYRGLLAEGAYIWRVAVGGLNIASGASQDCADDERIRQWSDYRRFVVYPFRRVRIRSTKELLIGTRFVQNVPFSRIGPAGTPTGFDMDLIRTIVERCLVEDDKNWVRYDHHECDQGVQAFLQGPSNSTHYFAPNHFHARIVSMPPGVDWLAKLQDRNIDLYIGSVTRAKDREHGQVNFTEGYLDYSTEGIVDNGEACSSISCLARKNGRIGVVESTTNAWLAKEILENDNNLSSLKIISFKSFPELETAFERQEVVAVIIDNVMAYTIGIDSPKVVDLKGTAGWRAYTKNDIGYPEEQFGIAVVADVDEKDQAHNQLLNALNCALSDKPAQTLIHTLYHEYDLDKYGTTVPDFKKRQCQ